MYPLSKNYLTSAQFKEVVGKSNLGQLSGRILPDADYMGVKYKVGDEVKVYDGDHAAGNYYFKTSDGLVKVNIYGSASDVVQATLEGQIRALPGNTAASDFEYLECYSSNTCNPLYQYHSGAPGVGSDTLVKGPGSVCEAPNSDVTGDGMYIDADSSYIGMEGTRTLVSASSFVRGTAKDAYINQVDWSVLFVDGGVIGKESSNSKAPDVPGDPYAGNPGYSVRASIIGGKDNVFGFGNQYIIAEGKVQLGNYCANVFNLGYGNFGPQSNGNYDEMSPGVKGYYSDSFNMRNIAVLGDAIKFANSSKNVMVLGDNYNLVTARMKNCVIVGDAALGSGETYSPAITAWYGHFTELHDMVSVGPLPSALGNLNGNGDGKFGDAFYFTKHTSDNNNMFGTTWLASTGDSDPGRYYKPNACMIYTDGISLAGNGSDYGLLRLGGHDGGGSYITTGTTVCPHAGKTLIVQDTQELDGTLHVGLGNPTVIGGNDVFEIEHVRNIYCSYVGTVGSLSFVEYLDTRSDGAPPVQTLAPVAQYESESATVGYGAAYSTLTDAGMVAALIEVERSTGSGGYKDDVAKPTPWIRPLDKTMFIIDPSVLSISGEHNTVGRIDFHLVDPTSDDLGKTFYVYMYLQGYSADTPDVLLSGKLLNNTAQSSLTHTGCYPGLGTRNINLWNWTDSTYSSTRNVFLKVRVCKFAGDYGYVVERVPLPN